MNFSSDTLSKFREILNMQPGDKFTFPFGEIYCHLGEHGRYIEIYATDDELKAKLQISVYDDEYELGFDICDLIFA